MQGPDAYTVFRRKRQPALLCAVRRDLPVSAFVQEETSDYGGTVRVGEAPLPGFRSEASRSTAKHAGYYLFLALDG